MRISRAVGLAAAGGGAVVVVGAILMVACVQPALRPYEGLLANTGKPALHAVRSDRLRKVMGEMNRLAFTRMPQELGAAYEPRAKMDQVVALAGDLAVAAQDIPDILTGVYLSAEHRKVFVNLAHKLRNQALALQEQAKQGNVDDLAGRWRSVIATCNACHSAFRVLPVVNMPDH